MRAAEGDDPGWCWWAIDGGDRIAVCAQEAPAARQTHGHDDARRSRTSPAGISGPCVHGVRPQGTHGGGDLLGESRLAY
jgi:hypothetical protein